MTAAIATLVLGVIIGYVGQRARLCFVAGYRDVFVARDWTMVKGVGGAVAGALGGFILFGWLGGTVPGFPALADTPHLNQPSVWVITIVAGLGVGFVGALAGGCPFRMHVLAAEGRRSYWYYLLGFYAGLIFYNLFTRTQLAALKALF